MGFVSVLMFQFVPCISLNAAKYGDGKPNKINNNNNNNNTLLIATTMMLYYYSTLYYYYYFFFGGFSSPFTGEDKVGVLKIENV